MGSCLHLLTSFTGSCSAAGVASDPRCSSRQRVIAGPAAATASRTASAGRWAWAPAAGTRQQCQGAVWAVVWGGPVGSPRHNARRQHASKWL